MEKLTQQEQEQIQFLQQGIIDNIFELGKISLDIENIKNAENQLLLNKSNTLSTLKNLNVQEKDLIKELTEKYKGKNINLETYEIV